MYVLRERSRGQAAHVQILDRNQAIVGNQVNSSLVVEVTPLISDVNMQASSRLSCLLSASRSATAARQPALRHAHCALGVAEASRIGDAIPIRADSDCADAQVKSNRRTCRWQRLGRWQVQAERGKPVARLPRYRECFYERLGRQ
jgi:hypothetical protein